MTQRPGLGTGLAILLTVILFFGIGAAFSQDEEVPELFLAVTGLSQDQWLQIEKPIDVIAEAFNEKIANEGFSDPPSRADFDQITSMIIQTYYYEIAPQMKNVVLDTISEEEYRNIQERTFLFNHFADWSNATSEDFDAGIQLYFAADIVFNSAEILDLSPEQQQAYQVIREETLRNFMDINFEVEEMFREQYEELNKEMEKGDIPPEELNKKVFQLGELKKNHERSRFGEVVKKSRDKFEKILTDEQKAKLQKMKEEMPESLWSLMPGNYDKKRPWRPGANSWMPGMGAPDPDIVPREAQPPKNQEKPFPGNPGT